MTSMQRNDDGTLPANAWPGLYPLVYITYSGLQICPKCANEPDTSDAVAAQEVYWEGPVLPCADCGEGIASAYGEPNDGPDLEGVDEGSYA